MSRPVLPGPEHVDRVCDCDPVAGARHDVNGSLDPRVQAAGKAGIDVTAGLGSPETLQRDGVRAKRLVSVSDGTAKRSKRRDLRRLKGRDAATWFGRRLPVALAQRPNDTSRQRSLTIPYRTSRRSALPLRDVSAARRRASQPGWSTAQRAQSEDLQPHGDARGASGWGGAVNFAAVHRMAGGSTGCKRSRWLARRWCIAGRVG